MAENIDFSRFAGRVTFPRTPSDLLSATHCPACFNVLTTTICKSCGLNLGHPVAAELHDASLASAAALDQRLALIGRIRYDTEHAAEANAAAAASPAPVHVAPVQVAPVHVAAAQSAPPQPAPSQPVAVRRKNSTIQIILLSVGVSLLSIAAIFFLVYAFVNYGVMWRTVIIAAITIAAIVAATLLRRHKLTAAAEGVAALAAVFIYGDAFALRANNYFGLASSDAALYWGIVLVGSAVAFFLWHRSTGIRTPNIVAMGAFAPGIGIFVGGLIHGTDIGTHYFFVFAVIAVAGLLHRVVLPTAPATPGSGSAKTAERVISLIITSIALVIGFFIAFGVAPASDWSATIAALALVAIIAAHLFAFKPLLHFSAVRVFAFIFSSAGAIFAASAVGLAALRIRESTFDAMAPLIAAAIVALVLDYMVARSAPAWKKFSVVGAWSAAGVLAIALITPVLGIVQANVERTMIGLTVAWSMLPTDVIPTSMDSEAWAVLALAIIGLLTAASWSITRTIRQRGPLIVWLMCAVIIAAVAIPSIVWLTVTGWLFLAAVAVLLLTLPGVRAKTPPSYRAPILATAITTMLLGYGLSWASTSTWWIGSITVIVLLIALRLCVRSHVVKATLLGIAGVLALIASSALARHLTMETQLPFANDAINGTQYLSLAAALPFAIEAINGIRFLSIAAAMILVLSAVPLGTWFTHLDRRVTFWLGGTVSVITALILPQQLSSFGEISDLALRTLLPEYATSLIVALLVLGAFGMWVALRKETSLRPERITASIFIAPAIFFAVMALAKLLALPELAIAISPVTSALLAAVASLTVTTLRPTKTARWALDIGVALVALPSVVVAAFGGGQLGWLVLLLAAVTVLVLAINDDGLFASTSRRRHLGWLALALATAGLWWKLADSTVTAIEPYVLPLTAALLIIAFLLDRANLKKSANQPEHTGNAAPLIALSGLVVSLLPLAINASGGTVLRAGIIAAVAVTLLLVGSFVRGGRTAQRWWDSAALSGAIGVVVLMIGRAAYLPLADLSRDAWIIGGFLCLIGAAYGQALTREHNVFQRRSGGSQILGVIAMTVVFVMEVPAFAELASGPARVIGLVILFAAVHVIGLVRNKAPFTRVVGWIAIGLAALTAFSGSLAGAVDEPEFVTVPIGLALVITGALHLRAVATARSWLWLAPGVIMPLLPSLVETFRDHNMWRTVILGVAGIAVIIIATVRKLQAPFAIGVVVVLIHGIATFLPQLRAAYLAVPWWLWLAVGGTLLIVLAIRYERRLRDLKSVAMKFAELR